jgi:hypothetical protein
VCPVNVHVIRDALNQAIRIRSTRERYSAITDGNHRERRLAAVE